MQVNKFNQVEKRKAATLSSTKWVRSMPSNMVPLAMWLFHFKLKTLFLISQLPTTFQVLSSHI